MLGFKKTTLKSPIFRCAHLDNTCLETAHAILTHTADLSENTTGEYYRDVINDPSPYHIVEYCVYECLESGKADFADRHNESN